MQAESTASESSLKIQSIRYLSGLGADSYPAVVDSLLASLDDESELVRYEALKVVHQLCNRSSCVEAEPDGTSGAEACHCRVCQADRKIVERLSELLLSRAANGELREASGRVRELALGTIDLCLSPRRDSQRLNRAPKGGVKSNVRELPSAAARDNSQGEESVTVPLFRIWDDSQAK